MNPQEEIDRVNEVLGDPTLPGHRICLACCKQLPLADYAEGATSCNKCSESLEMREIAERKEKKLDKLAGVAEKMIQAAAKSNLNVPHVTEYVQELIEQLGGVKELVRRRLGALQSAEQDDSGSARVMRGYESLEKLIVSATEHLDTAPDLDEMNREELAHQLAYLLMQDASMIDMPTLPSPETPVDENPDLDGERVSDA